MTEKRTVAMPTDLKHKNLNYLLNMVCWRKQFTVAELASLTQISRQTVTKLLDVFLQMRIIVPSGKGSSTNYGGKKPARYALNDDCYVICITTCNHCSAYSLLSFAYRKVDEIKSRFIPATTSVEDFVKDSSECCRKLLERNSIPSKNFFGIAMSMGGIVDSQNGTIQFSASVPSWGRNVPVRELLMEAYAVPRICVENAARVCSLTMISQENLSQKCFAVFYFDYGIGVTVVENGQIAVSRNNINNELGHMVLDVRDQEVCGCGAKGCFEVLISERRVRQMIQQLPEKRQQLLMEDYDPNEDIRIHVMQKAEVGNVDAAQLTGYMADVFGLALRNVILAFDPDHIVLQGSFARCTDSFLEAACEKTKESRYLSTVDIDIRRYNKPLLELQEIGGVTAMLRELLAQEETEE